MNKDQFQGKWQQLKGKVKEKWGKLTDDDMTEINGKREQLLGKLQARYGYAKEKAEEALTDFEKTIDKTSDKTLDKNKTAAGRRPTHSVEDEE